MDELDRGAFTDLVNAVVRKCFGHPLEAPLSEPESKHLSNHIEEQTGLVVGWRSLKNYAAFLLNPTPGKQENPSMATLDTLARYVLNASPITEAERKQSDRLFQYWFRYREPFGTLPGAGADTPRKQTMSYRALFLGVVLTMVVLGFLFLHPSNLEQVETDFRDISDAALHQQGWFVQHKNPGFWNRRGETPNRLTLFTLKGDTWPKAGEKAQVQNLLLRPVYNDCFRAEVHFNDFVPAGNWQQAGLLFMEDTLLLGKSIRLSLAFNNFFGGFQKPGDILIQAISSYGKGDRNLEEFIHQPLFQVDTPEARRIAETNLRNVAFRVEKQGNAFRVLYSASPVDNFSFKEITTYSFGITPRYIGLFALKGFVDSTATVPVKVRYFRLEGQRCE
nr:hypothetical protein [uncultured Arsenicibacter sp.]